MSVFDWCVSGKHENCKREFQKFVIVPNRKRGEPSTRLDFLDEWVYCGCTKRGCECYKARKTREEETGQKATKKTKPRRRKS